MAGPALQVLLALGDGAGFAGAMTIANLLIVERRPKTEWNRRLGWLETALSVGQGGALILAAWLSGLSARDGLLIGAIVPAAAIPLALLLIPRMPSAAVTAGGAAAPCATPGQPATARSETTTVVPSVAAQSARASHRLASIGQVGEWGPASPSRTHHLHQRRRPRAGLPALFGGGLGWMLAAWIPAYAGSAIVFASLPLFVLAGRVSQRRGR